MNITIPELKDKLRLMLSDYKAKESAWKAQKSESDQELGRDFGIRAKEVQKIIDLIK